MVLQQSNMDFMFWPRNVKMDSEFHGTKIRTNSPCSRELGLKPYNGVTEHAVQIWNLAINLAHGTWAVHMFHENVEHGIIHGTWFGIFLKLMEHTQSGTYSVWSRLTTTWYSCVPCGSQSRLRLPHGTRECHVVVRVDSDCHMEHVYHKELAVNLDWQDSANSHFMEHRFMFLKNVWNSKLPCSMHFLCSMTTIHGTS